MSQESKEEQEDNLTEVYLPEVYLPLQPEGWKYKEGSDYSITTGMEYEVFTKEYRDLREQIRKHKLEETIYTKNNLFIKEVLVSSDDDMILEALFTQEGVREVKTVEQEGTESISIGDFFVASGILILLLALLIKYFKKKK